MAAALNHCVREGYLLRAPHIWKPERKPGRQRWLSRDEVAALLNAARTESKSRLHLPLYILIAFYTGARSEAILGLRWTQNTTGGWVDLERGRIDFNPGGREQTNMRRAVIPIPRRLLTILRLARRCRKDHVIEFNGKAVKSIKKGSAAAV